MYQGKLGTGVSSHCNMLASPGSEFVRLYTWPMLGLIQSPLDPIVLPLEPAPRGSLCECLKRKADEHRHTQQNFAIFHFNTYYCLN